jgi:hypothetical protein
MRWPARCLAVSLLALLAPLASAQHSSSFPDTPGVIPSAALPPPTSEQATLFDRPPPWHVDLLLGFPAGLRVQRALGDSPLMVEGFAGLEVIVPTAALGLRWQGQVLQGACNALLVNPGVDAYVASYPRGTWGRGSSWRTTGGGGADVDLVWRHALGDHAEGHVGLKVGLVAGGGSQRTHFVLPVLGVFMGWGF